MVYHITVWRSHMNYASAPEERPCVGANSTESLETDITETLVIKHRDLIGRIRDLEARANQVDEEYRARRNDLQARKKPLEEALFHIEALLRISGRETSAEPTTSDGQSLAFEVRNPSVTEAAFAILQKKHQPLHYREITEMLQDKGIHIPGKNPAATLLSRMSRDKRFRRGNKRGVYVLKGWRATSSSRNSGRKRKSGVMRKRTRKARAKR